MTAFLDIQGIIYDLSPPYAYKSNSQPEQLSHTIVTIVRSMTLDYADVIPQALWAEAYSMAIHIKNCILYSTFKLKQSLYKIIFGDKPSINHLYPFRAKWYVHVPKQKQIRISKLSSL
jgi:hypothetical protein